MPIFTKSGETTLFVVKEMSKNDILRTIDSQIDRLQNGNFSIHTGAPVYSKELERYIIPNKMVQLQEVTIHRILKLMKYLKQTELRHTTRRDVWYGVTTEEWGLYDPNHCPKCSQTEIESKQKDTGRKKKDGAAVMTTILICQSCSFEYTDLKNPYDALGGDLVVIERVLGVEKEDFGVHSGQKGFLYGSPGMSIRTRTRGSIDLNKQPTIMFDLPRATSIQGFDKLIMLEKESFVSHLVPIEFEVPDFKFLEMIGAGIITSQGYEGKYNKAFGRLCLDKGIKLFSFHDADGDGIEMDNILRNHSMSGAHLPDNLILKPHRMGFFPSVALAANSPPTPMSAQHIKGIRDLKKRLDTINDPLYNSELDILLNQGVRWELQSMSALHATAGQAYVLEYLRNQNIRLKPDPDINRIRREIYNEFRKEEVKNDLINSIRSEVRSLINEKVVNIVIDEVLDSLATRIDEVVEDVDEFPDLPDNEVIHELWEDLMARRMRSSTRNVERGVVNSFGDISTSAEITEDEVDIQNDTDTITIDVDSIVDNIALNADRAFHEPIPKETRPNFYDVVLDKAAISKNVAGLFKAALETKLEEFPSNIPAFQIPEEIEPEDDFDTI